MMALYVFTRRCYPILLVQVLSLPDRNCCLSFQEVDFIVLTPDDSSPKKGQIYLEIDGDYYEFKKRTST